MAARVLDGTAVAAAIRGEVAPAVAAFTARAGRPPGLGIVLVGDDPASAIYVRNKLKSGAETGMRTDLTHLPAKTTLSELLAVVDRLNRSEVHDGIRVQSPLPAEMGADAERHVFEAVDRLTAAGLEAEGSVGNPDPCVAVSEAWDPKRFDEIIVSTLPMKLSKWLHAGLPERIGRITGAPVTHVVSQPTKPAMHTDPAPAHEEGGLGPLKVLAWGGQPRR